MTIGEGADRPYQRLSSRELLLIFLFWTSLATVSAVSRLLDPRGFGFRVMSPAGPIALAFIEAWIWALFTPLIFWLSSRVSLARSKAGQPEGLLEDAASSRGRLGTDGRLAAQRRVSFRLHRRIIRDVGGQDPVGAKVCGAHGPQPDVR